MLGPIKLCLGTRFLGGLRTLLDLAVLILKCSRHIALGQHLFPKLKTRTSLSMRSWQRQAGGLQRPFVNIITNRLLKKTALLPLSLTSEICVKVFWNIACATLLILLLLNNILQTWLSLSMPNLIFLCGFHASCSSACRTGASTL